MLKNKFWIFIALAALSSGCSASQHAAAAQDSSVQSDATAQSGTSAGHLHLTGAVAMDLDFAIDQCAVAPPGDGLLSGYHMTAKDGAPIVMLSVVLKDYAKDGSYGASDKTAEGQVGSAMRSGTMGPLTVMVSKGEGESPLTTMLKPESKLNIQISNDGAKGDAEFTDMETPITAADIDPSSKTPPHGKKMSGSVTWSCAKVDHINSKMNDAVNGMFTKLMPPK
ncbi:MAG: hypothetical protein M3126_00550 [Candidatus Eremiobacteraeota bacterium]|nr:hypothetical protein [Candidatus Eremiobacteraeota bacterium]